MTGSFYCVENSKTTIIYRVYEPPKIRYQYPGESWQEITARNGKLTYTLDVPQGQCLTNYRITAFWELKRCYRNDIIASSTVTITLPGKIKGMYLGTIPTNASYRGLWIEYGNKQYRTLYSTTAGISETSCKTNNGFDPKADFIDATASSYGYSLVRVDGLADNCDGCIFKVFEDNIEIFSRTELTCPIVENIPCSLSDTEQQINIDKLAYEEKVEVIDYAYEIFGALALVYSRKIPSECLNIYKTGFGQPSGYSANLNTPLNYNIFAPGYQQIAQICSAPGCPPPEYQVICGSAEKCPEGTCEVDCGDSICCYGTDGIAVKSIPK